MKEAFRALAAILLISVLLTDLAPRTRALEQPKPKLSVEQAVFAPPWAFLRMGGEPVIYGVKFDPPSLNKLLIFKQEDGIPKEIGILSSTEEFFVLMEAGRVLFFPIPPPDSPQPGTPPEPKNQISFPAQKIERAVSSQNRLFLQLETAVGPLIAIFDMQKRPVGQIQISGEIKQLIGLSQGVIVQTPKTVFLFDEGGKELTQLEIKEEILRTFASERLVAVQDGDIHVTILNTKGEVLGRVMSEKPIRDLAGTEERIFLALQDQVQIFTPAMQRVAEVSIKEPIAGLTASQVRFYVLTMMHRVLIFQAADGASIGEVENQIDPSALFEKIIGFDQKLLAISREGDDKVIIFFFDENGKPIVAFDLERVKPR